MASEEKLILNKLQLIRNTKVTYRFSNESGQLRNTRTKQWPLDDGAEDKSSHLQSPITPDAIHRAADCCSLETACAISDAFIHMMPRYASPRSVVSGRLNGMMYG